MSDTAPARSPGRPKAEGTDALVQTFLSMKPGYSFFVEGLSRHDLEFLRKPVTKAGVGIQIVETLKDEIYGVAGTRVWRCAGDYDEL